MLNFEAVKECSNFLVTQKQFIVSPCTHFRISHAVFITDLNFCTVVIAAPHNQQKRLQNKEDKLN